MSMKLHQAVASRRVVVQNTQNAEVSLHVKGKPYCLAKGQQLNITEIVDRPKDALLVGGLVNLVKKGHLRLL